MEFKGCSWDEAKEDIKRAIILFTPYGPYKCAIDNDFVKKDSNLIERVLFTTSSVMFNSIYVIVGNALINNYLAK